MGPGVGNALVEQPGVQLVIVLEAQPRREEAFAHQPDLVLYLAFLPARCRRAGDRLNQIVAAHLQEAAVVLAVLADEHRLHRGLHVVVDAARAGTAEEGERPVMGIEDHLLRLSRIGPHKHHPAVAEPDMGDLHRRGHTVDHDNLVAPVELIGIARREEQRHIGIGGRRSLLLCPALRIAPDGIVAARVPSVSRSRDGLPWLATRRRFSSSCHGPIFGIGCRSRS